MWLFVVTLAIAGVAQLWRIPRFLWITAYHEDWGNFWAAGATVGSKALLDPSLHSAWQISHHMRAQPFVYPPAVAYFYAPFSHLSPIISFVVEQALMIGFSFLAAVLVSRIYGFTLSFAAAIVFAWMPLLNSIIVGQSTAVALMLFLVAVYALVQNRQLLAGVAIGALMFKPTNAVVLLLLLMLRRGWRALIVALFISGMWYLLSTAATAGDWHWPVQYAQSLQTTYALDFTANQLKSFSLPTLLMFFGAAQPVALALGLIVLTVCLWLLSGATMLEAASVAPIITLAVSPHAWPYDAGLLVPTISYYVLVAKEPWRTRIVVAAYVLGVLPFIGFNPLIVVVLGGLELWIAHASKSTDRLAGA